MYKLVIADDEGKTTVVPLVRDEITIGRKEGNTIRLTDRNVSRRHAKLRKVAQNGSDEGYLVEDLKSYNGVKVNGRRVGGEIVLKAGDQITIGDYQLAIQLDDGVNLAATIPEATVPHGMRQESVQASGSEPTAAISNAPVRMAAPQPPARIVMTSQPAPGAEFALARPTTRIGRAEELDVWINHRSISREHAEITNDGTTIKIRDLGSANGMRINGRESKQGQLKSGDTLELGQVRFRFVGTGEHFVFEFDRHAEADAGQRTDRRANRVPIVVASGIVGIAIIGAFVVANWKSPAHPDTMTIVAGQSITHTQSGTGSPGVVDERSPSAAEPIAAGASLEELIAQAVTGCLTARSSGSFDLALTRASEALTLRPGDPGALECEAGARQDRLEHDAFSRGVAARERGDLPGAYLAFDELSPESRYRLRPEVEQTMQDFASDALERAAESEPDEALRLAQTVLNMTQIERETREAAQSIVRRVRSRSGTRTERERTVPRERESSPAGTATRSDSSTAAQSAASSQTPLDVARECLARADNACVVRALEGRARNEPEWRLLIETYRAMSNTPRMLDSMERYIQRFPSGPRTSQYRQVLMQHGR
jgi:pSer/pThr/pTyr-binding forkhead associated (FHA) protein